MKQKSIYIFFALPNMKKILFYIFLTASILLSFRIIGILTTDFQGLTEFGFGYLTGIIILLLITGSLTVLFWIKSYRKK